MSVMTTSGTWASIRANSAGRSPATPTSSRSPWAPMSRETPSRSRALSSASTTRVTAHDGSGPVVVARGEPGAAHLGGRNRQRQTPSRDGRMSAQVVRYRLRAALRRRLGAHVAIAALVAVLGGTAMASIAAARRTQSSFPRYLASTHPSDVTMTTYGTSPDSPANGYSPALEARLAQIPGVAHVESWTEIFGAPLRPDGAPD